MFGKGIYIFALSFFCTVVVVNAQSAFLDHVKNNTIVHHIETNTVWQYLGSYSQIDGSINYITEIPVFQFLCDVLPVRMAYTLQACIEYRDLLLKNSDVARLKEVAEDHSKSRAKRQILEGIAATGAAYTVYRIVGDLLGPSNLQLAHRLEDVENFQVHQNALNEIMNTAIASLQNNQLAILKAFKDVYDDANATRQYLYQHIRQVIAFRNEYDSFAKHAILQEMRNHYDKIVHSITKIEEQKLNLDFLTTEQRTITYNFVYEAVKTLLPEDFGASLSAFIPKLLVHQILSFTSVNEKNISYELTENDFQFDISVDPKFEKLNQTVDLDEIIPKIVGHLRVENIFGRPINISQKKTDLYKVTKLPFFVTSTRAAQSSHMPTYFTLSPDGYSSEWENHDHRRCTFDERSKFLFCAVPTPIYSQIQNPCIRSIVYNTNTSECTKDEIDLFSPQSIRLAPDIFAISTDSKLQCLEKTDKKENRWTNINKVSIIRTKCNSYISCGKFDLRSDVCRDENVYILSMKKSIAPYRFGESVNEAQSDILTLRPSLNISALLNEIDMEERLREEGFNQFRQNVSEVIQSKWSLTFFLVIFAVATLLIVVLCIFCKCYFKRSLLKLFWCYEKSAKPIASSSDAKLHTVLSQPISNVGDAVVQVPPPIIPRNRPDSFFEKLSIPSRCVNYILSPDCDRNENMKSKFHNQRSAIVAYDAPAVRNQLNYTQNISRNFRTSDRSCRPNASVNQDVSFQEGIITATNQSDVTSGSFFEEDKSTFSGYKLKK
ncbi:unnamed protein product [Adineta ricciae]|uniref:Envelope protein n=1 Tax=Adineta ricciae TaxID=249248 RepID=A0A815LRW3_ADIRI|nr:unnamed protein product [Adineta ricciae]CAF1487227.1 unnamed protein product [Adineta ricciae]